MRHLFTILPLVGVLLLTLGCGKKANDRQAVFWPNSSGYAAASQDMKITPDQAREILDGAKGENRQLVYADSPLFIADNCYVFGIPKKTELPVTGYYVNGFTGQIEYRESRIAIKAHEERLPDGAFYKITEIARRQ